MRYLWLTWTDPCPEHDGQKIYSGRLIDAVARAGVEIDVLCFASAGSPRCSGTIEDRVYWWPVANAPRSSWASVFSSLPNIAFRCDTPEMRKRLFALARTNRWDAIVLDGLYAGWALPWLDRLFGKYRDRPRLVYVSHNHEATTRATVARNFRGNPVKRALLKRDAAKAARLERAMSTEADLITAITAEDANRFDNEGYDASIVVLPPGYAGWRVTDRGITADTPRRAIMIGSFDWVAKRMNLEEFVSAADAAFAAAGAELQIIGNGDPQFLARMRRKARATEFVGHAESIEPYLADARIAVVPERSGGGFKLKVLDYVFHRVPIAALRGSVAGTPLEDKASILTYDDMTRLAEGTIAALDDLPLLNRLQNRAYRDCSLEFDWSRRGADFVREVAT